MGRGLSCYFDEKSNYTKKIIKIHMHPQFLPEMYDHKKRSDIVMARNDLSLIEVQPFTLSEELNILPGCLFESNLLSFGDRLLVAGLFWFKTLCFINWFTLLTSSRLPGYGLTQQWGKEGKPKHVTREGWNETYPHETKLHITKYSQSDCEVRYGILSSSF